MEAEKVKSTELNKRMETLIEQKEKKIKVQKEK